MSACDWVRIHSTFPRAGGPVCQLHTLVGHSKAHFGTQRNHAVLVLLTNKGEINKRRDKNGDKYAACMHVCTHKGHLARCCSYLTQWFHSSAAVQLAPIHTWPRSTFSTTWAERHGGPLGKKNDVSKVERLAAAWSLFCWLQSARRKQPSEFSSDRSGSQRKKIWWKLWIISLGTEHYEHSFCSFLLFFFTIYKKWFLFLQRAIKW